MIREELRKEKEEKPASQPSEAAKALGLSATWANGFEAESADKAFRIHIGGRFDWDNTWFTQDDNLLLGPDAGTRFSDGSLFRRARFRTDGLLWGWIEFVTEVNFANIQDAANVQAAPVQIGSVGLTSFFLTFQDLPIVGHLRAGHFKAPVGLERYSSANSLYYMERSSIFDAFLGPNQYQSGLLAFDSYLDDRVTFASAFTRVGQMTLQSFGFDAEDGKYAGAGRLTALPVYEQDGQRLVHLGVGYQHQTLVGHQFQIANRPLLRSGSGRGSDTPNVLATGTFYSPNGADVVDFEAAVVYGPVSLSAEYALARVTSLFSAYDGVNFSGPRGNATYQAFYVEGGWFVTPGDYRRYDKKTGTWARTIPRENVVGSKSEEGSYCCGHGAVQLVARYTYLDMVGGNPVLTPTTGGARAGRQQDMNLGVTWYLNSQMWVAVNYVFTHVDSVVAGASGNFQGIGTRLHIDF